METRTIYKCFISSPGDCKEEREAWKTVIERINNGLAKHLGINFETFMWEDDVLPNMGENGQAIIDKYIDESKYDIFIGIMKNRFGQPTTKAGSGTEHEFNAAIDKKKASSDNTPLILFFFGKEMIDPDNFDNEQYEKVKVFKKKTQSNGLYIEFSNIEKFKEDIEAKINLFIKEVSPTVNTEEKIEEVDKILHQLEKDLKDSLKVYNETTPVWIDPIISSRKEVPTNPNKNDDYRISIQSIIENPSDVIIKAPSEFGLTSLAHHIKLEAWKTGRRFLYIDAKSTKTHKVIKHIIAIAKDYYFNDIENIDCILLDSICFGENGVMQIIKNICDDFEKIPLIILNTTDNNFFLKSDEDDQVQISRKFTSYYLLPLPQNEVRKIVKSYSASKSLKEDNETTLKKVAKDLETLNMHRTVKNCISILRASFQIGNDYSPVNRTKLLETILTTIFKEYEIPTYHDKTPDVKDCSFVLGYWAEVLVKKKYFEFTDKEFKDSLHLFCQENYIDLDLDYLLNVLKNNSILGVIYPDVNYFKNSYWAFYFIAHRMHMNKEFKAYIFENKVYIDFPDIIEFYTGIDRNKEDALIVLKDDINETLEFIQQKVNLPNLNPYKAISWNPDVNALQREEARISENVISSGLPDEVKDKYDDKTYDQQRPYVQVFNHVMREYSFLVLMRQISAASRALRNSDFVNDPSLKKELLQKITLGWNEFNKLLVVMTPLLAEKGNITFEGAGFCLEEDYASIDDPIQKKLAVILALPTNIVRIFKDDLFSTKMGPLLIHQAQNESNSLIKHELMLILVYERPKKWRDVVDKYIVELDKNSYFLSGVLYALRFNIDYRANEIDDVQIQKNLARKCIAKHQYQNNNPNPRLINKIKI